MKINEVEAQVGITKKNIRFYEEQGLLSPRRNSENGYRDYGQEEVDILRQIKLMRKLGLPLEDIRQMQAGASTVADGMRRHLVTLEREKENLEQSMVLCRRLTQCTGKLQSLDAEALLDEMSQLEEQGATFQDKQTKDTKPRRYIGAFAAAAVMTAFLSMIIGVLVWAYLTDSADAPPLPLVVLFILGLTTAILMVLLALWQRVREISKGEIDDAKNY